MPAYLTATLYAPFASFGGLAVGERRESETRPTRSGLIGLLGAALGIERADEAGQQALSLYGFATQTSAGGQPLTDYHTAQMPGQKRNRRFFTRAGELGVPKTELNTVLTSRDYRMDTLFIWAIWPREGSVWTLHELATSLNRPRFSLSLGRKSCPLGLPLAPHIGDFGNARAALGAHFNGLRAREEEAGLPKVCQILRAAPREIIMDQADATAQGEVTAQIISRRDIPVSRARWQFTLRQEALLK
jgi:CRISPR system Cascade subunit CasD